MIKIFYFFKKGIRNIKVTLTPKTKKNLILIPKNIGITYIDICKHTQKHICLSTKIYLGCFISQSKIESWIYMCKHYLKQNNISSTLLLQNEVHMKGNIIVQVSAVPCNSGFQVLNAASVLLILFSRL